MVSSSRSIDLCVRFRFCRCSSGSQISSQRFARTAEVSRRRNLTDDESTNDHFYRKIIWSKILWLWQHYSIRHVLLYLSLLLTSALVASAVTDGSKSVEKKGLRLIVSNFTYWAAWVFGSIFPSTCWVAATDLSCSALASLISPFFGLFSRLGKRMSFLF